MFLQSHLTEKGNSQRRNVKRLWLNCILWLKAWQRKRVQTRPWSGSTRLRSSQMLGSRVLVLAPKRGLEWCYPLPTLSEGSWYLSQGRGSGRVIIQCVFWNDAFLCKGSQYLPSRLPAGRHQPNCHGLGYMQIRTSRICFWSPLATATAGIQSLGQPFSNR